MKWKQSVIWMLVFILIVTVPVAEAGWFEDSVNWVKELFGFTQEEAERYVQETIITNYYKDSPNPDGSRTIELYSNVHFVEEDNEWKELKDVRSLKDTGLFEIKYLQNDGVNDLEVEDFNLTSIKLKPIVKDSKELNKDIPLKKNGIIQKTVKLSSLNKEISTIEEMIVNNVFENNYSYGFNSTTIQLVSNNTGTEYADARLGGYVDERNTNYGDGTTLDIYSGSGDRLDRFLVTANRTYELLNGNTITNASWVAYQRRAAQNPSNVSCFTVTSYWDESGVTWNSYNPNSYSKDFLTKITNTPVGWGTYNLELSAVQAWADGTTTNYGFFCEEFNVNTADIGFYSSEVADGKEWYFEFTYAPSNTAPNPATNLKINSTTDNNLSSNNVYAEFITGTDQDNNEVVYNISWIKDEVTQFTFGNLTNITAITLEMLNSSNLSIGDNWKFSVVICDIPTYVCSSVATSASIAIGSQPPTAPTINFPNNNTINGESSIEISCNGSTDPDGDDIYYQIFADENNPPTTLVENSTDGLLNSTIEGAIWFRCRAADEFGTTSGYTDTLFYYRDSRKIINNTAGYPDPFYETASERFSTNVTINYLTIDDVSASLNYNGTKYTATKVMLSNQSYFTVYEFYYDGVKAPLAGDMSGFDGYWNFTLSEIGGITSENATHTFTNEVRHIEFGECNSTLTTQFINFTFKDEANSDYVNASIRDSTFTYSLDPDQTITKTLTYVNNTEQFSFPFCVEPINQTLHVLADIDYWSDGVYPQRTFNQPMPLTNNLIEQVLWLVKSSEGLYVTFQVINSANQPIDDVFVNITRSDHTVVENGYTGNDGAITFWLNPDLTYTADFIKSGYDLYSTTQKFTQSTYTITLSGVAATTQNNYIQGMSYDIYPKEDMLTNDTTYNFNVTFGSTHWTMQSAGFTLTNETGSYSYGSSSCTGDTGCIASANVNVKNERYIVMEYYWVIEGNYSNGTRVWTVGISNEWGQSSVGNFVADVNRLGNGFNDFTKAMISMFIILLVIGTSSYISGIYSPLAIMIETFALVCFLDYISFIPTPIKAVPNFIPIMVGLMLFSYIIWEFSNK